MYSHSAFGRMHLVSPGSEGARQPPIVQEILRQVKAARRFGPLYDGKIDLLAIFETRMLELSYMAMYHTGDGIFWVQNHLILPEGGSKAGDLVDTTKAVSLA